MESPHNSMEETRFFLQIDSTDRDEIMIPSNFTKTFLSPCPRNITLSTTDNKVWPATMDTHMGLIYIAEGWRSFKACYMLKAGQLLDVLYGEDSHFTIYLVGNKTSRLFDISIGAKMSASLSHQQSKDGNSVPLMCSKRKRSQLDCTKRSESEHQTKPIEYCKRNGNASTSEIPTERESNNGEDSCDEDYAIMNKSNNSHNYLDTVQVGGIFHPPLLRSNAAIIFDWKI